MRLLFLVAFVVIAANAASLFDNTLIQEWKTFKLKYNKNYGSLYEDTLRMRIYAQNRILIARHNQRFLRGLESFEMGENQFSDLLAEEFRRTMLGFKPMDNTFKGRKLMDLSEQNLVDCSKRNTGCNGGYPARAYEDIIAKRGINLESDYPYQGQQNDQCKFNPSRVAATVKRYYNVRSDEKALMEVVATKGPVSIVIRSKDSLQFYKSGVYYEAVCPWKDRNASYHAMLVVGYGTTSGGVDYWLVKNSWGTNWGEKGYVKMARNRNNMCGIANLGVFPDV
ncbi:AGAP011828-PA-like protein [Anopheles sinensis]|uniref:AGAP011828-PA-like protein n=1 Tax=Anopheles sinensis TaxID=74873 RepID=A0A084W1Y0_ANOSI|nr:AGAP011828-PA-like protein [Anopheles sinensis]